MFLEMDTLGGLECSDWLGWMASEPKRSPVPCIPSNGIIRAHITPALLTETTQLFLIGCCLTFPCYLTLTYLHLV